MSFLSIISVFVAAALGLAAGLYLPTRGGAISQINDQRRIDEAKAEAERIRKESKDKIDHMQKTFEMEEQTLQESIKNLQDLVNQKEDLFKRRQDRNKSFQVRVDEFEKEIKDIFSEKEEIKKSAIDKLSSASGLSREKAFEHSKKELEHLISDNKEKRQTAELEEFEDDIMRHARAVLQVVIQRLGVQSSVDKNNTSLTVHHDNFKGLLIGKEGNNIKYFESLLPVSVIFNYGDPKTIHVGGVNLIRRNIAKLAIQKLEKKSAKSKKIDRDLIKSAVEEAEKEILEQCDSKGKWALKQIGIDPKKVDDEIVNLTGRLYFRTSYGQNVLYHSLEMAFAARLIAELTGNDGDTAMQAAFFHDIGKAIDHDIGGAHDDLSKEILEKHGYDPKIVHAAYAHHDKVPCVEPADYIVKAVDGISGSRPGARMESVTNYFERMKQLEEIAKSFDGVNKVHTMSAGREVRVLVNKDQIKDADMEKLADEVAGKISEEVSFPGIIKVNLIRQTRSVDYARDKSKN